MEERIRPDLEEDADGSTVAHARPTAEASFLAIDPSVGQSAIPMVEWLAPHGWQERFEIGQKIGAGGMGHVWRAIERTNGREVALKWMAPDDGGADGSLLARAEVEAQALLRLRDSGGHPHVVPIIDFHAADTQACLVMEYVEGQELKVWCDGRSLTLSDRVELIVRVARAAGWFHGIGVIHRDLKSGNILVRASNGEPVIVDFSIAKVADNLTLTLTNEALGTAPYMAPEQFDRQLGAISPATDVYALGATLYRLLTEASPHPGSFPQILQRHAEGIAPARPSAIDSRVPAELDWVVLKALANRPEDRYPDGNALADDLERYLRGDGVTARPISTIGRLARWTRRKPSLAGTAAACVVLAGLAAWGLARYRMTEERSRIESRLGAEFRKSDWDTVRLDAVEADLARLERFSPTEAQRQRELLIKDVGKDIGTTLALSNLTEEQWTWMRQSLEWLMTRDASESSRLAALMTERESRWNLVAEAREPFADLGGLFSRGGVHVSDGFLYPDMPDETRNTANITVSDKVPSPVEVRATFSALPEMFNHLSIRLTLKGAGTEVRLYDAESAPQAAKDLAQVTPEDTEGFFVVLCLEKQPVAAHHFAELDLLKAPVTLSLRVEPGKLMAMLNEGVMIEHYCLFDPLSQTSANYCGLTWPKGVALNEISLHHRRSTRQSPLEKGDLLSMQREWDLARQAYETLIGDPTYGAEARAKLGTVLFNAGKFDEAVAQWEATVIGTNSHWRDYCAYQLWSQTALRKGRNLASPYLEQVPDPIPPSLLRDVQPKTIQEIAAKYNKIALGLTILWIEPDELAESIKVYKLLGLGAPEIAKRFGLALRFARMDAAAEKIYIRATGELLTLSGKRDSRETAYLLWSSWCRIPPSERDPRFAEQLQLWRNQWARDPTFCCIAKMEDARDHARAGRLPEALAAVDTALTGRSQIDPRIQTAACLLKGVIFRMRGDEIGAQRAWSEGLKIADTVTRPNPMHLADRVVLQSLARTWKPDNAHQIISEIVAKNTSGNDRTTYDAKLAEVFFARATNADALNAFLDDERGRQFTEDYALCREAQRPLLIRLLKLGTERYILETRFPSLPTEQEAARVRSLAGRLVEETISAGRQNGPINPLVILQAWIMAEAGIWTDGGPLGYSAPLVEDLKWLLERGKQQGGTSPASGQPSAPKATEK